MATDRGLQIIRQYSDEGRQLVARTFNDSTFDSMSNYSRTAWMNIIEMFDRVKSVLTEFSDPQILGEHLRILFRDEILRNNTFFVCIGLGVGATGGFLIGVWMARPILTNPVMKSIACVTFFNQEDNVTLCHTTIPHLRSTTDVLVRVRAVSINRLDESIANGYGINLRRMIQRYNSTDHMELPLVIGRACAGIVEGVGEACKSGLEIGDEVWIASPWYECGLASEIVVAPESRMSRKPFIIGFEGATSLPYSGCVALDALKAAVLNEYTSTGKRVLVQDGCSPVGCVLTQLAKKWGAYVTATCHVRSVPVIKALGADDVIPVHKDDEEAESCQEYCEPILQEQNVLFKELSIRQSFDVIFFTTATTYNKDFMESFLVPNGIIVDTVERPLISDNYGALLKIFYSIYVKLKRVTASIFKFKPDWGGPHLCHLSLDTLAGYVNDGILQTVVDQVYTPQDAEEAILHCCSPKSIGSTIVTFRS